MISPAHRFPFLTCRLYQNLSWTTYLGLAMTDFSLCKPSKDLLWEVCGENALADVTGAAYCRPATGNSVAPKLHYRQILSQLTGLCSLRLQKRARGFGRSRARVNPKVMAYCCTRLVRRQGESLASTLHRL